jgi:hypothetical protein
VLVNEVNCRLNTCNTHRMSFVVASYMKNTKRKLVTHVDWTCVLSNYKPCSKSKDTSRVGREGNFLCLV